MTFDAETTFTYNFNGLKEVVKDMFDLHNERIDAAFTVLKYLLDERHSMKEQITQLEERVKELEGKRK